MQGFYNVTERIRVQLAQDEFVNTITYGDIFRVDLKKQTIFPLSHVVVNNATMEGNIFRYNISVMAMDIVDISKDAIDNTAIGQFRGNDNEQDVLNTQFAVIARLLKVLEGGDLFTALYQLDGNPNIEPFTERFENYLAGWVATFDVLIPNDMTACDAATIPTTICEDATAITTDSDGNELYSNSIPSGATETQVIQDSTAVLKDTLGTTISTTSILAQGSDDIIAPNSTYLVEYVNGTDIQSGSIVSGGSVTVQVPNPIVCADATVNVNGVFWDSVPSGGTENVIVRQSSGSTQVGSKQGQYWRIADSTAVLKTTGGTTISTTSIKAEASANIVAPNTTIEVNGTTEGTVVAGSTVDIQLSDSGGVVTPDSVTVVGNDVQIVLPDAVCPALTSYSAMTNQTGQTTSYEADDDGATELGKTLTFYRLKGTGADWHFGHTWRFTGITGGYHNGTNYVDVNGTVTTKALAFPETIVLDWTQLDRLTGDLIGCQYNPTLTGNVTWLSAKATCFGFTTASFATGWRWGNINEIVEFYNEGTNPGFAYPPFEDITAGASLWSSTTPLSDTTRARIIRNDTKINNGLKSAASARAFPIRTFNISEL